MKHRNESWAWAAFLLLAGIFLLLKNLGIFGQWGEAAWGGLFAIVGLGFVVWFLLDRERWWRAIAGFTLIGIGLTILLAWRNIDFGDWDSALVLFGVALGFWMVLLSHSDNWWAVIPAGVLTVVGVLVGLRGQLSQPAWLAVLLLGLGLVFLLLYLVRFGQHDTHWAGIPAAALLLLGLATLAEAVTPNKVVRQWWPVVLLAGGIVAVLVSLARLRGGAAESPAAVGYGTTQPAPGTSAMERLPEAVPAPPSSNPQPSTPLAPEPGSGPATGEQPADIYDLLAQQPPEPGSDTGEAATK